MLLSVRLSPEEEALLEAAIRHTSRSKSQLVRQAIHEFCARLQREEHSAYELGRDLFGQGLLARSEQDDRNSALGE